jgi:actin related protein 2/3 complex subunit 3
MADGEGEDIVDEVLKYFRANMLFSQFDIEGNADRTLIYLTAVASDIIKKNAKVGSFAEAQRGVTTLTATKVFKLPGDADFLPGLGHFFEKPSSKSNADFLKSYLQQCRVELGVRLLQRMYNEDGTLNKWWMSYSKKSFMGMKAMK